jgi:pullulanase/glycogen debranching enzyme
VRLNAPGHRSYHYWHAFVPGLSAGQVYAYRAVGPFDPARRLRFDPTKVLLDPYGRAVVVPDGYDRFAASRPGDNTKVVMRSAVVDPDAYDWDGDTPLRRPFAISGSQRSSSCPCSTSIRRAARRGSPTTGAILPFPSSLATPAIARVATRWIG